MLVSSLALFYYTLIVLLGSILAAALCLATFFVSRKRAMLYASIGFLFYFFDVALVFQDDYVLRHAEATIESVYFIGSPLLSIVTACGCLTAVWLVVADAFGLQGRFVKALPGAVFVIGSLAAHVFIPEGPLHQFVFYTMRSVVFFGMLVFAGARYIGSSEAARQRLWRYRFAYVLSWVFGLCVVIEDVVCQLMLDPHLFVSGALWFFPERNFAENGLAIMIAAFCCYSSSRTLMLHFRTPPCDENERMEAFIADGIAAYQGHYSLSNRETEVLRLILLGKDNQNIASELNLAFSTVKVHVHNILRKTGQANRQDLMRDFRMRS